MSDNIQEQDMEGILSSIKGILEEDEQKQQVMESVADKANEDVLGDVLNSADVTDILELSPDMVVDALTEQQSQDNVIDAVIAEPEITTEVENNFDAVEQTLADNSVLSEQAISINEDNLLNKPFFESTDNNEIVSSDKPFFETDNNPVADNLTVDDVIVDIPVVEEAVGVALPDIANDVVEMTLKTEEEPITENTVELKPITEVFEVNNTSKDDLSLDELLDADDNLVLEEVVEPAPVVEEVVEPAPVVEEVVEPAPVVEEFVEPAPVVEEVVEPAPVVEEIAIFDPVIEVEPVMEEEQTQDVSTNIMSNFAKMFSHEEKPEETTITSVGNSSKTLEDFVVDAIQKAIGKEISAKWNSGADFNSFVEAEIRHQVELWIANNMSGLIEETVKKEVERVMAKVGS